MSKETCMRKGCNNVPYQDTLHCLECVQQEYARVYNDTIQQVAREHYERDVYKKLL